MEFVCYSDWNQLPEKADALFAQGAKQSVFFSRPWFENLTDTVLENDQAMLLACVIEAGNVLAILPMMKRNGEYGFPLTHLYSSLYSLLLAEERQQEILDCLVHGLIELPIKFIRLDPAAENDGNIEKLLHTLHASGSACHRKFRFYNWIHRLQGQTYQDYMTDRPARLRNTIARKQRKLKREHGYDIQLYIDDNLQQGIADFNTVYDASWKARELFSGFIEGLARRLSESGWLRLAILYIDGKPAAGQFWFVVQGKASIFKLAYDEKWKHYSPGSILISYLMEYVIDIDKVEEIDFLTGNDAYKADWMSERRQRFRLLCVMTAKNQSLGERFVARLKSKLRLTEK